MVLVALPHFRNETHVGIGYYFPPGFRPPDITSTHQNSLSIHSSRIRHMQVGHMGKESSQSILKIEPEVRAGHLQMGEIDAIAQSELLGLGDQFVRHHEDVLMPLTSEMPWEGSHILGNQFRAAEVNFLA